MPDSDEWQTMGIDRQQGMTDSEVANNGEWRTLMNNKQWEWLIIGNDRQWITTNNVEWQTMGNEIVRKDKQ